MRMFRSLVPIVALVFGIGAPGAASAQEPALAANPGEAPDLPVSISRIKERMSSQPELGETRGRLRLTYRVNVYGRAPAMDLLQDFIIVDTAPAAYGGPSHAEMVEVMTPKEWRPRAISIGNVLGGNWRTQ